jgi:ABC-type branched-subunit amino acid transport system substrate-binding protein
VLPSGGSPGFRDFAAAIAEGVELAAATYLDGTEVTVLARDDQGDPSLAAAAVQELERGTDALAAVGFLETGALEAAADVRATALPLISPTARLARGEGVYTLSGADPAGAAAMARYAARAGFARVAMVHSRGPGSTEEADAFEAALRALGVPLVGRFVYDPRTTSFQDQIRGAQEVLRGAEIRALGLGPDDTLHVELLEPVALFVPVPPEDVELLAPQIIHYGLDTLAIQILGTGGWTDDEILQTVDDRHTTGVVATAPVNGGPGSPAYARFRQAYERHFRRTLVSSVPALGYDATLLLLEAAATGARTPARLGAALDQIRDLQGATGSFSVSGGRLYRRTEVMRIEHGVLIPTG